MVQKKEKVKMRSLWTVLGCAHCPFRCEWALGKRQHIEVFEHIKKEHPELWTDEDEAGYQAFIAL